MHVADIYNHTVVIIGKTDSIYAAAVLMRDRHTNYIIVVESNNGITIPVGSLTDQDIVLKVLAADRNPHTTTIDEVMCATQFLARESDNVTTTLKRMRQQNILYIPVTKTNLELIGVLSIDDILDSLSEQLSDINYILNCNPVSSREDILALR